MSSAQITSLGRSPTSVIIGDSYGLAHVVNRASYRILDEDSIVHASLDAKSHYLRLSSCGSGIGCSGNEVAEILVLQSRCIGSVDQVLEAMDDGEAPIVMDAQQAEAAVIMDVQHEIDGTFEPAAEIEPGEAAEMTHECWATRVESTVSADPPHAVTPRDMDVVIMQFGRDPASFDEAILLSALADHARSHGVDVKPDWANGAKTL